MNKNIVYLICLMILLFLGITGCGPQDETRTFPNTRYVESYDGVRVVVPDHPKRIFSVVFCIRYDFARPYRTGPISRY